MIPRIGRGQPTYLSLHIQNDFYIQNLSYGHDNACWKDYDSYNFFKNSIITITLITNYILREKYETEIKNKRKILPKGIANSMFY